MYLHKEFQDRAWTMRLYLPLFLLFIYLLGLNQSLLFDVDEGAFTEATREMLMSGDWGHTTLNGADRFDKPIGIYWLQALCAYIFGFNEFSYRLPSALSGFIASLALASFVKDKWGLRSAWFAAAITSTSLGHWAMARTATADALLGLLFFLIFLDLWRTLDTKNIFFTRRLALWVALGLLVKGPVALVVPVGALLIFILFSPEHRSHVKTMLLDLWAWVILLTFSLPWYLYAFMRHGQKFIDGFILKHNVARFTESLDGHSGNWAYFILALPLLWMPWSVMWFKSLSQIRTQLKDPFLRFSWAWFVFVFGFFTFAQTKLPHYLLYAGPAMCILVIQATQVAGRAVWAFALFSALIFFSILISLPIYLQAHNELIQNDYYKLLLSLSPDAGNTIWFLCVPLVFFIFFVVSHFKHGAESNESKHPYAIGLLCLAVIQASILSLVILPWWSQALQSPVHQLAVKFKDSPNTIVQWNVYAPSFSTYRQKESPVREPMPGEWALVKNMHPHWPDDWNVIEINGPLSIVMVPDVTELKP